jgi:hypothetical protein
LKRLLVILRIQPIWSKKWIIAITIKISPERICAPLGTPRKLGCLVRIAMALNATAINERNNAISRK